MPPLARLQPEAALLHRLGAQLVQLRVEEHRQIFGWVTSDLSFFMTFDNFCSNQNNINNTDILRFRYSGSISDFQSFL